MHLTVMDYDVFSNDDFAGHVYFNLNDVCGLRGVVTGGFANVPQETRNLFHPKPGGQYFEGTHFDIHISSVILPLKLTRISVLSVIMLLRIRFVSVTRRY